MKLTHDRVTDQMRCAACGIEVMTHAEAIHGSLIEVQGAIREHQAVCPENQPEISIDGLLDDAPFRGKTNVLHEGPGWDAATLLLQAACDDAVRQIREGRTSHARLALRLAIQSADTVLEEV